MPLIGEIANCLNELMPDFTRTSPMDIISEFDIRFGRAQLAEEFYKIFLVGVAEPGTAHLSFARLPFDIVATTNVDQLLEETYFRADRFPQVVMFDEQLPVKDTSDDPVTLLKLHGDVNFPDRIIFTEGDYDTFIARFPLQATYLASLLITRTPLFIGYSVDDYDLRMIWNIIGERLGRLRRQAYVIEVAASPSVIARYQRRGVQVINLPGRREDFGQILTETFRQLRRFLANNCPEPGIPPCAALGESLDVGDDDESGDRRRDRNNCRDDHGRKRRRHHRRPRRDDSHGMWDDETGDDRTDDHADDCTSDLTNDLTDDVTDDFTHTDRTDDFTDDLTDDMTDGFTDGMTDDVTDYRTDDCTGTDQTSHDHHHRRHRFAHRRHHHRHHRRAGDHDGSDVDRTDSDQACDVTGPDQSGHHRNWSYSGQRRYYRRRRQELRHRNEMYHHKANDRSENGSDHLHRRKDGRHWNDRHC